MRTAASLMLLLGASCAPMQLAGNKSDGSPWAAQFGGLLHQADGYVLKVKNGPIEMEQIVEKPDGTQVAKQVSSDIVTYGVAKLFTESEIAKDNNAKDVQINQSNNDLKGKAIDAEAAGKAGDQANEALKIQKQ